MQRSAMGSQEGRRRKVAPRHGRFNPWPSRPAGRAPAATLLLAGAGLVLGAAPAAAAPPALPDDARGSVVLYCPAECPALSLPGFAVRGRLPRLATRPVLVVEDLAVAEPPAEGEVVVLGEVGDLAATTAEAIRVSWASPVEEAPARLAEVMEALAAAGVPAEDLDAGRLLAPAELTALAARLGAAPPDAADAATVAVIPGGDGTSLLATRGLVRLGLPELVDEQVPDGDVDAAAARLNAVAQALVEGAALSERLLVDAEAFANPAARHAACALQGTATLAYDRGNSDVLGRGVRATVVSFDGDFGTCADQGTAAPTAAPAADSLATVQARALQRLQGPVRDAARAGLPPGDRLFVKAPFLGPDQAVEWLWVEVESWGDDDVLRGTLSSAPRRATGVAKGAAVQAHVDVLFDYLWVRADGSQEGNTTQAFL